jgi:hypothetical protein
VNKKLDVVDGETELECVYTGGCDRGPDELLCTTHCLDRAPSESERPLIAVAAAAPVPPVVEYEIRILSSHFDRAFSVLHLELEVPNAPKMPYSRLKSVYLQATVVCKDTLYEATGRRLGTGADVVSVQDAEEEGERSVALARAQDPAAAQAMGVLAMEVADMRVARMPTDEEIARECHAALTRHLREVEKESARYRLIDEAPTTLVGMTLKVRV